jgi:hypothetical protein
MVRKREMLDRPARRAALRAASVEIRRAQSNRSPLYVGTLTARLRREYPRCQTKAGRLQSEIVRLAARESVAVVVDSVSVVSVTR